MGKDLQFSAGGKITLGKWKGTVDTKKLKLLSGKIFRAGSRYMVAAGRK